MTPTQRTAALRLAEMLSAWPDPSHPRDAAALLRELAAPPCACGDRPASECPGEWEPGCDLGANKKYVRAADVNQSLTTEPDCYGYASRLATGIWEKHYKADSPQWKPLDDTLGVLTQIDNMASGLTRKAEPAQEPVAQIMAEYDGGKHGRCIEPLRGWTKLPIGTVLYAAPPQRQPLSDEQIKEIWETLPFANGAWETFARAIERAHGIGETK